jgi:protein translocase SecG subunit
VQILITILHVTVCIVLILVVLLQAGKGANMGAVFGGSSQTIFGSSGPGTFLGKMTTAVAIIFMLTSFSLSYGLSKGEFTDGGRFTTGGSEISSRTAAGDSACPGNSGSTSPGGATDGKIDLNTGKWMPVLLILTKSYLTGKFPPNIFPI